MAKTMNVVADPQPHTLARTRAKTSVPGPAVAGARRGEGAGRGGDAGGEASEHEEGHTGDEDATPAVAVGYPPTEQEEAAEGEDVRRDHPLEAGGRREVQRPLDGGQGHVHDGG